MRESIPPVGGAYALVICLDEPARLAIPRLDNPVLAPGWYVYAGSAYGPGGLRARVARHLTCDKSVRWHVDHLTAVAPPVDVMIFSGGDECAIVTDLTDHGGVHVPVPGFGSSDCNRCRAHLIALDDRTILSRALRCDR
jgi:Uri superfamily endonuclease